MARNCLANEARSARRQRGLVAGVARLSPPAHLDQTSDLPDPELHNALAALQPEDRELLTLWAWEDLRPREIALVLGITVNAVNIRLHRARGRLAQLLIETHHGKYSTLSRTRTGQGEEDTMIDDLESRLRRADPARATGVPQISETSIRDLMEAAMQHTTTQGAPRPSRRLLAVAAGTVLVLGGAGLAGVFADDAPDPSAPLAMELALPGSNTMSSCIQYSVDVLARMPTAFSGRVLEAADGTVVLEVGTWYRGGDAEIVELRNETGETTSIDGVEFIEGDRYLVTASEAGTVNSCGYTARWKAEMAADFDEAFGKRAGG